MNQTLLHIDNFSYAYPGGDPGVLKNIQLDVLAGECICITGPTGSGKSTLLLAIKNLLPSGKQSGKILPVLDDTWKSDPIGMVLQNPETQLLTDTIGAEIAFGLENLCIRPDKMRARVLHALSAVGLDFPLDFSVADLSMGQKYRLMLASVLALSPSLILLDEPGAQLDPEGISKLKQVITKLKISGVGFILCEHHPHFFSEIIDSLYEIDPNGMLKKGRGDFKNTTPPVRETSAKREWPEDSKMILDAENLCTKGYNSSETWSLANFSIGQGQRVGFYGRNGAGKTTLLRCMTGFVPLSGGRLTVFGKEPIPKHLRGKTGCLFQNPQKQLFENTVFDEVAFPLKRMDRPVREIKGRVKALLNAMGLEDLAQKSPHKLSFGQKHLVVLAGALAFSPELMILDDPFAGLDHPLREKIKSILLEVSREENMTLIWTGHHDDEMMGCADLVFHISGGTIGLRN